jgi:hypothetical protein
MDDATSEVGQVREYHDWHDERERAGGRAIQLTSAPRASLDCYARRKLTEYSGIRYILASS